MDTTNNVSKTFENAIDFLKEMIIVCIDKVRSSGGFSIEVIEAVTESDTFLIKVKTKGPKPMDMVTSVMMQLYHVVKIKKTNKKIKFIEL
jgi:hypothetical protein